MKRRLFKNSAIIRGLGRAADGLYDAMSKSAVGRGLTAYDAETKDAEKSLIATRLTGFFGRFSPRSIKRFFARGVEHSALCEWVGGMLGRLASAYMRQYGVFLFTFGFYGLLMYVLTNYAIEAMLPLPLPYVVTDAVLMLAAVPMVFSRRRLSQVLCESRLTNLILFDFLGLRRETLAEYGSAQGVRSNFAFLCGTLCGIATLAVSPVNILLALGGLLLAYLILTTPESGMVLTALLIPFAPAAFLGYLLIYITFCYCIKLARGKRTVVLDLKDYAVLLFALSLLLGGIFSLDPSTSFTYSVKMAFYVLAYILTVNLVRSRRWLERMKSALVAACVIACICGIVQEFALSSPHFITEDFYIGSEVTAFFASSEVLAQFIALTVFFIIAELMQNTNPIRKLFMLILTAVSAFCLYLTGAPWAILAVAVSAFVFFLIYSNRTIFVLLGALLVIPASRYILPVGLNAGIDRLSAAAAEQVSARAPLWHSSMSMARDYFWSGSGVGTYNTLFQSYANESVSQAVNSGNLYLQIIIEVGVFGLALFLISILLFAQHSFSLFASEGGGKKSLGSAAGIAGILSILIIGATDYVWADARIFLCFWVVMGVATATGDLRVTSRRGVNIYLDETIRKGG